MYKFRIFYCGVPGSQVFENFIVVYTYQNIYYFNIRSLYDMYPYLRTDGVKICLLLYNVILPTTPVKIPHIF